MPDGSMTVDSPAHSIFDRLPPDILGGLSVEQRAAIASAAGQWDAKSHRVNIRISLPLLPERWYLTVLGGPERRTVERRRVERVRNPASPPPRCCFRLPSWNTRRATRPLAAVGCFPGDFLASAHVA